MVKEAQAQDEETLLHGVSRSVLTHVADKQARSRHKELMRQLGATVASGSESQITEEEEWIQQHCPWTDSDAEQFPTDDNVADDPAGI